MKILLTMALFAYAAVAMGAELSILVGGNRDAVLGILRKAIDIEFNDGIRTNAQSGVGYQSSFRAFPYGDVMVVARIFPFADGGAVNPTAFKIALQTRAQQFGDGSTKGKGLLEQIAKLSSSTEGVFPITNSDQYRDLGAQANHCVQRLIDDPELAPISSKVSLHMASNVTLSMLANTTRPSGNELEALSLWSEKRKKCFDMVTLNMSFYPPSPQSSLLSSNNEKFDRILLSLYKGEITFGEFNEQRRSNSVESVKKANEISVHSEHERSDQRARQAEAQRRSEVEAQRLAIEQQKADAMTRESLQIKDPAIGNPQSHCVSTVLGNTVQTNCN